MHFSSTGRPCQDDHEDRKPPDAGDCSRPVKACGRAEPSGGSRAHDGPHPNRRGNQRASKAHHGSFHPLDSDELVVASMRARLTARVAIEVVV